MVLAQVAKKYEIGQLDSVLASVAKSAPVAKKPVGANLLTGKLEQFGDQAPFAEPYYYQDWYSPCTLVYYGVFVSGIF